MNTTNENHSSADKKQKGYTLSIGHDRIRVVSIFVGTKSASEVICDAAVKKILYDHKDNL